MHIDARILMPWLPLAVLLGALAASAAGADETLPGNPYRGAELARELCATCHSVEKGDRGVSTAGAPAFQDVANDPAITAISLGVFFRSPHETMPDLILSQVETNTPSPTS